MNEIVEKIKLASKDLKEIRIMEVCGGHTYTIMKYGIRQILPKNIKLMSGPGCPICVTSQKDIDSMIEIALNGERIACYSDILKVPGTKMCLKDVKQKGAKIKEVYSAQEVLKLKDHIFFGLGFETTTPMTAFLLKNNIKVFSTHRLLIPAMNEIIKEININGFISPGHVGAIIGSAEYEKVKMPQVISSFTPYGVLESILKLIELIKNNENKVINNYSEVVKKEGNTIAKQLMNDTMKVSTRNWRGLGEIPNSGLEPIKDELNARIIFSDLLKNIKEEKNNACRCSEVLKGLIEPRDCKLFGKICTPKNPIGACMVSEGEGACGIAYKFGDLID